MAHEWISFSLTVIAVACVLRISQNRIEEIHLVNCARVFTLFYDISLWNAFICCVWRKNIEYEKSEAESERINRRRRRRRLKNTKNRYQCEASVDRSAHFRVHILRRQQQIKREQNRIVKERGKNPPHLDYRKRILDFRANSTKIIFVYFTLLWSGSMRLRFV